MSQKEATSPPQRMALSAERAGGAVMTEPQQNTAAPTIPSAPRRRHGESPWSASPKLGERRRAGLSSQVVDGRGRAVPAPGGAERRFFLLELSFRVADLPR